MTQLIIWIAVAIAIGFVVSLAQWQAYIQSVPAGLEFKAAQPKDFPQLNQTQLDQYTTEITSLGFSQIADYTAAAELGKFSPSFFRLFQNSAQCCHAVIGQSFPEKVGPTPLRCMVISFLEENWIVRTTNEPANFLAPLIHLSRHILTFRPRTTPTDLFQFHLNRRQSITRALNVEALKNVSTEDILIKMKERAWRQKQIIKRQNVALSLIKAIGFTLMPRYELLGDYPQAIANRKR